MRFDTLLVANRGEIACRIIRTARAAGLRTIAVHTDADQYAAHVTMADQAVRIGEGASATSYLSVDAIIDAARRGTAQAVHPGYGFLSENAGFARACREAGLIFVGPTPEAIDALGNKTAAKQLARQLGVPCLPGADEREQAGMSLAEHARRIGAPLMIKAAAGGGGRGMRRVDSLGAFDAQLSSARAESLAAFGSEEMLIERLLHGARHVEVQIIGDEHGNYRHLGERDCSTQRRSQKIIEEAPAPGVDAELRERLGNAAITLARGVDYTNAGTVEFLLGPDGDFYFLEMNTRLQVEHPVSEAITGIDLVDWQLRVAQGEVLDILQRRIEFRGCAIEARLCAEDPYQDFAPQPGAISRWTMPEGLGVRCDHGLGNPARIPAHYDSMIAKIIVHAPTRESARLGLINALGRTHIHGLRTNRDFLVRCLQAHAFRAPALSTGWLDDAGLLDAVPQAPAPWLALAAGLLIERGARCHGELAHWSSSGAHAVPILLQHGAERIPIECLHLGPRAWNARIGTETIQLERIASDAVRIDSISHHFDAIMGKTGGSLDAFGYAGEFGDAAGARKPRSVGDSGEMIARMHGLLASIHVEPGAIIGRGSPLFSIEAMKMTHRTDAPFDARVLEICARTGQQVGPEQLIVRIEALNMGKQPEPIRPGDTQ